MKPSAGVYEQEITGHTSNTTYPFILYIPLKNGSPCLIALQLQIREREEERVRGNRSRLVEEKAAIDKVFVGTAV